MNRLEHVLTEALAALADLGADCALIGGLAVSARAEPRFTRDVDLAVACPDDRAAEELVRLLLERGYLLEALVEQEGAQRLATARLLVPEEGAKGVVLDLLFASSGIEKEVVDDAELLEIFPGRLARIARKSHLLALKVLSRDDLNRPQDAADLRALLVHSTPAELARVPMLLSLIEARGYSRGRDLQEAWRAIVEAVTRQQKSDSFGI